MNEFEEHRKPSKRVRAAARAGEIRRRRLAEVREREAQIETTVIDVLAARLAIDEAGTAIADGVRRLKALGETQNSIAQLCEMSIHEVRSASAPDGERASHLPKTEAPKPALVQDNSPDEQEA